MDPRTVFEKMQDFQVIDVRWPHEWEAGRFEGARHIPMDEIATRLEELERDRPVVAVCRTGDRSGRVAGFLKAQGFDAHNMEGGIKAWESQGLPFAASDGGPGRVAHPDPAVDQQS